MPQQMSPRLFALASLLYFLANAYIQGNLQPAGSHAWLTVLLGAALLLPVFFLCAALSRQCPGQDLPGAAGALWGIGGQRIVGGVLFGYALLLLIRSISRFAQFVSFYVLPDTPRAVMIALLLILAAIMVRRSAAVIGRWAGIMLPAVLLVIGVALASSISVLRPEAMLPILEEPMDLLRGLGESMVFPFGEPVVLFTLLTCVQGEVQRRHWLLPWVTAAVLLALTFARNTMVLGKKLAVALPFATHHADSVMGYSIFSLRIEALTSLIPAAAAILEAAILLHLVERSMEAVLGRSPNRVMRLVPLVIAGVLAVTLPGAWSTKLEMWWKYVSLSVQTVVLSALLLTALFRRGARRKILARRLKRQIR